MEVFKTIILILAYAFIIAIHCGTGSKYFEPCKMDDQECIIGLFRTIKRLASIGAPEFELEPFDPMTIKDFTIGVPGVAIVNVTEAILRGPSKCIYVSNFFSVEHRNGSIELECNITVNGTYEAFIEKPIFVKIPLRKSVIGKGEFYLESVNVGLLSKFSINIVKDAQGVIKLEFKDIDVIYDVDREGHEVKIQVTGLKSGEENIDSFINEIFKKNWKSYSAVLFPSFIKERFIQIMEPELKIAHKLAASNFISDDLEPYVNKIIKK